MEQKINNVSLSFTCNEDWESMTTENDGRFCQACQKKVYDLNNKNMAYFLSIMQENGNNVCGRFSPEQIADPKPKYSIWKRMAIAAMVFIGLNVSAQEAAAQTKIGEVAPRLSDDDCKQYDIVGKVAIPPRNAELKSLHAYLVRKCLLPSSVNGQFLLSFYVSQTGEIKKAELMDNKLPDNIRLQVTKALKNAPKWKSDKNEGGYPHTLSLNVKNGRVIPYL